MNKSDLTRKVSEKTGFNLKESEIVTNAVFASIEETLAAKEKVQIVGFGTFETRERAERTGRNPQTGETITVPGGTVPAFKPGKELREVVKGK